MSDKKMLSMSIPLAERLRPRTLDEYIGQAHLVGQNGVFRKFLETGNEVNGMEYNTQLYFCNERMIKC